MNLRPADATRAPHTELCGHPSVGVGVYFKIKYQIKLKNSKWTSETSTVENLRDFHVGYSHLWGRGPVVCMLESLDGLCLKNIYISNTAGLDNHWHKTNKEAA